MDRCPECGVFLMGQKKCPKCGVMVPGVFAADRQQKWLDGTRDDDSAADAAPHDPFMGPGHTHGHAPRPGHMWLDGTKTETPPAHTEYIDGKTYHNPDAPMLEATAYLALMRQRELDEKRHKVTRVFPDYSGEELGLFGSIFFFFSDTEAFFMRTDMQRLVFRGSLLIVLVSLIWGTGIFVRAVMWDVASWRDFYMVFIFAGLTLLFPLGISITGMIFMSLFYREFASWKRIFGIYAFAYVIFAFAAVPPMPYTTAMCVLAFAMYVRAGFENVFGLDLVPSVLLGFGLPIVFSIAVYSLVSLFF